jgi:hypothetical protein
VGAREARARHRPLAEKETLFRPLSPLPSALLLLQNSLRRALRAAMGSSARTIHRARQPLQGVGSSQARAARERKPKMESQRGGRARERLVVSLSLPLLSSPLQSGQHTRYQDAPFTSGMRRAIARGWCRRFVFRFVLALSLGCEEEERSLRAVPLCRCCRSVPRGSGGRRTHTGLAGREGERTFDVYVDV